VLTFLVLALQVATAETAVGAAPDVSPAAETVVEVRVHGNHTTPNEKVLELAGDVVGQTATEELIAAIAERLDRSGRFSGADVRKRYLSIDDPNAVVLMIVVDERPGVGSDGAPGSWQTLTGAGMWMPVLHYADGYGFTYGARVSFVDLVGRGTRLSMPYTWGGERQARVELERTFEDGPFARIALGGGIVRRENPYYQVGDVRTEARLTVDSAPRRWLRLGGTTGVGSVQFDRLDDRMSSVSLHAAIDTRADPVFPRDAVLARVKWEHIDVSGPTSFDGEDLGGVRGGSFSRTTTDVHAYVGVLGSNVLAVRGLLVTASSPPPPYEQALLGGSSMLRGHDLGYRVGDNLSAASAELRIPLTSPLAIGRIGIKTFADVGTVYPVGAKLAEQRFDAGYGAGIFATATVLSVGADLAWSRNGDFNFHFLLGMNIK
jgi:outer membrane protein assembly factor BamA